MTVALVLVPLIVLAGAEAVLRLVGAGYPTSFLVPEPGGKGRLMDNPKFGWRFFPRGMARTGRPLSIAAEKPKDVVRIVVLGESAAYGDPDPAFGLPRVLEVLLRERFPGQRVEVINAAMTAINSHVIREIARDCAGLQADAWVIYMGNNEVVGPFGAGTVFSRQAPPLWLARATMAAKRWRVAQVMQMALEGAGSRGASRVFTGMDMFSENRVAADDPRLARVLANFDQNLREILQTARGAGAEAFLCTVPTNIKDCAPFASTNRVANEEWKKSFEAGVKAQTAGDLAGAASALKKAVEIDPGHAEALFRLGKCEAALGRGDLATPYFRQARNEDLLRFRADTRINNLIRSVYQADTNRLHLLDLDDRLIGAEGFYEHVHLNPHGTFMVGIALAESIRLALAKAGPKEESSEEEIAKRLAFTDWNKLKIAGILRKRMSRAPFTFQFDHAARETAGALEFRKLAAAAQAGLGEAAKVYEAALRQAPEDCVLHENFAEVLAALGDYAGAASHARVVTEKLPGHAELWARTGIYLAKGRKETGAEETLLRALELDERSADALFGLALLKMERRQEQAALELLERALKERPDFAEARVARGEALAGLGRKAEAIREWEGVLELEPGNARARTLVNKARFGDGELKGQLEGIAKAVAANPEEPTLALLYGKALVAAGNFGQARKQFENVVRLDPGNGEGHYFLGEALTRENLSQQALEEFTLAARLLPEDASAHLNLGVALAQARRFEEALTEFERVLRLEPNHSAAKQYAEMARARVKR